MVEGEAKECSEEDLGKRFANCARCNSQTYKVLSKTCDKRLAYKAKEITQNLTQNEDIKK